jgi:hypothetical protein
MTGSSPRDHRDELTRSGWSRWLPATVVVALSRAAQGHTSEALDVAVWSDADSERLRQAWAPFEWITLADALATLRDRGVLDEQGRLVAGSAPDDVIELTDAELTVEAARRWRFEFEPSVLAIVELFSPDAAIRPVAMQVTVTSLAEQLRLSVHTARAALELLADRDDFTVTPCVADVDDDGELTIVVDWSRHDRIRGTEP